MKEGPLVEGIAALGPGDSRKIDWGQFGGLYKALDDEKIEITSDWKIHEAINLFPRCEVVQDDPSSDLGAYPDIQGIKMMRKIIEEAWRGLNPSFPFEGGEWREVLLSGLTGGRGRNGPSCFLLRGELESLKIRRRDQNV